jgi:uncharacterized protein YaaW (UPF0174 family)
LNVDKFQKIQKEQLNKFANDLNVENLKRFESITDHFNEQFEILRGDIYDKLKTKVTNKSMNEFVNELKSKINAEQVSVMIAQHKNNMIDVLESYNQECKGLKVHNL